MNAVEMMMEEHKIIKRMLIVVRKACHKVMQGEAICYEDFAHIIDFVRSYADNHHHGKEEKFLFNQMLEHLGSLGEKLIKVGMLVEHDLGRLYMKELEEALERVKQGDDESRLDVIANAISYTHLLERHIGKEDELIYPFAMDRLSSEVIEEVDRQCAVFEEETNKQGIQKHYIELLGQLEEKYLA